MKHPTNLSAKVFIFLFLLFLPMLFVSCNTITTNTMERPADKPSTGVDLSAPEAGLESLASYRQMFTLTMQGELSGKPFESVQEIERIVNTKDESILVHQSSNLDDPLYAYMAQLGDYRYAQQWEGQPCRAENYVGQEKLSNNPALRLPAVFGMLETGQEEVGNFSTVHYTFNENSLEDREDQITKASGEVWVSAEQKLVVKYSLKVELNSKDFTGTRTWSYELSQSGEDLAIRLPVSCQPVLSDVPVLPNATDVINLPGFQKYLTSASKVEVVKFYFDQLSSLSWQPLPGSSPDKVDLSPDIIVQAFAGEYQEGGRLLVIQITGKGDQLQVIIQSVLTKKPIQIGANSGISKDPLDGESDSSEEDVPSENFFLPSDLPIFPNAEIINRLDSILIMNIKTSPEDIFAFYEQELGNNGWTLTQDIHNEDVWATKWSRDAESIVLNLSIQSEFTELMIMAVGQ